MNLGILKDQFNALGVPEPTVLLVFLFVVGCSHSHAESTPTPIPMRDPAALRDPRTLPWTLQMNRLWLPDAPGDAETIVFPPLRRDWVMFDATKRDGGQIVEHIMLRARLATSREPPDPQASVEVVMPPLSDVVEFDYASVARMWHPDAITNKWEAGDCPWLRFGDLPEIRYDSQKGIAVRR